MPRPTSQPPECSGRRRRCLGLLGFVLVLGLTGRQAAAQGPEVAPPQQPPPYALFADPDGPLKGIAGVRLLVAMSAEEAEACGVSQTDVESASTGPLRAAGITIIDRTELDPESAAAVPELFVATTIVHDESDVCAASLLLQLGLDTNVVLLYRNADSAPGTLRLSNAYAELDSSAGLLVGVPPTFGNEVRSEIARRVEMIARAIAAANPDPR